MSGQPPDASSDREDDAPSDYSPLDDPLYGDLFADGPYRVVDQIETKGAPDFYGLEVGPKQRAVVQVGPESFKDAPISPAAFAAAGVMRDAMTAGVVGDDDGGWRIALFLPQYVGDRRVDDLCLLFPDTLPDRDAAARTSYQLKGAVADGLASFVDATRGLFASGPKATELAVKMTNERLASSAFADQSPTLKHDMAFEGRLVTPR